MEYNIGAMNEIERLVQIYRQDLLTAAMNVASTDPEAKEVGSFHVDRAYEILSDK